MSDATSRIEGGANGAPAAEPTEAAKRLAFMEHHQAIDMRDLRSARVGVRKLKRSIAIRTGRIDELRRIVMAEAAAKGAGGGS